jgi:hypothetical protein
MVLTDAGQIYFVAGVPKYVANWGFGGAAHRAIFGWDNGRFLTLVGRGKNRTGDGKYVHYISSIQLISPHHLAYDALLLDADGISRGDRGSFVYQTR